MAQQLGSLLGPTQQGRQIQRDKYGKAFRSERTMGPGFSLGEQTRPAVKPAVTPVTPSALSRWADLDPETRRLTLYENMGREGVTPEQMNVMRTLGEHLADPAARSRYHEPGSLAALMNYSRNVRPDLHPKFDAEGNAAAMAGMEAATATGALRGRMEAGVREPLPPELQQSDTLSQIRQRQSGDLNVSRPFGNRETRAVSTPYSGGVSLNMGGAGMAERLSPTPQRDRNMSLWGRTLQGDIGTQQVADVTDLPEEDLQVARNMGLRSMMERRQQRDALPQVQATRTARAERDQEAMAMRQQRAQEAQDVRNLRIRGPLASMMMGEGGDNDDQYLRMISRTARDPRIATRAMELLDARREFAATQPERDARVEGLTAGADLDRANTELARRGLEFSPTQPANWTEGQQAREIAQAEYDKSIQEGKPARQAAEAARGIDPTFQAPPPATPKEPLGFYDTIAKGSPRIVRSMQESRIDSSVRRGEMTPEHGEEMKIQMKVQSGEISREDGQRQLTEILRRYRSRTGR